ncbi:hypothetical protein HFN65_31135 [Rhizobium laguerreae]|nr:hypothetical protein [Rhizobium laguerreae]
MISIADQIGADFISVARLAGVSLPENAVTIEKLAAPHLPPSRLPAGKMAVYVFARGNDTLKVGKVGAKSQARYTSQHYNPGSAMSTLAASILSDAGNHSLTEDEIARVGQWIRANVDRANFLIDESLGMRVLALLEAFIQCRLNPKYEGYKSQAAIG